VVVVFGVAILACDLGDRRVRSTASLRLCERCRLAFKFKLAVDKGNAAALVSFLVFDAVADTKIRQHEPDGLTMELIME
jgi:hypothetical protein